MKNRKPIFLIAAAVVGLAFGIHHFSCSPGTGPDSAFGSATESPLKDAAGSSKACAIQESFRGIFDLYKDRVVYITTEQLVRVQSSPFFDDPFMREFFGRGAQQQGTQVQKRSGLGTGFVISEDGYICTNHHVIAGVDKVNVSVAGKTYKATVVGSDERTDVALLKVHALGKMKPVYFGDSDQVRVGDWAIAIGNPFGLDKTFTVGVVSATGRRDVDFLGGSHIQTDASINPGNSGGPLINIYGEVIGVNRMIYSRSGGYMGIGFAIPANDARSILEQLKTHRKIRRGFIGVSVVQITEEYARELGLDGNRGAFVGEVVAGGPAARGGIAVGDVILKVNDEDIKDYKDLLHIIGDSQTGKRLAMTIWRDRRIMKVFVQVGARPD